MDGTPDSGGAHGRIAIVLPYKDAFAAQGATATALLIRDRTMASRHRQRITVFGRPVPTPFPDVHFRAVRPAFAGLLGGKRGEAIAIARATQRPPTALYELHQRVRSFWLLASRIDGAPLTFHVHTDPLQDVPGLEDTSGRAAILARASQVLCISRFVRERFLDGIDDPDGKARVLPNGVRTAPVLVAEKAPLIAFAGRLDPPKGVHHLVDALVDVLPRHPQWRAEIAGSASFAKTDRVTDYERTLRASLAPLGDRAALTGYQSHEAVLGLFRRAAIVVVPSLWQEGFGMVAAEALGHGCAVIAYRRGGLPEVVEGRGLVVDEPEPKRLADALERVVADADFRGRLQAGADADFPFTIERTTALQDAYRDELLEVRTAQ
ncbi:MAG: glycosyltransferase family 4 protein [Pseudomonadota bacterium]